MNQHMRFGHGRIVGHYGTPGNARWFTEFSDDPDTYRRLLNECRRVLRDDRHIYIMFDSFSLLSLGALVREFFDVKCVIVWDKVHLGMGHYFRRRHEQIVFASKGRRKISRRDLHDVWAIPRLRKATYPTQKPVELFERMLAASAEPGYVVCDPFTGSGSSAVAALRHGLRLRRRGYRCACRGHGARTVRGDGRERGRSSGAARLRPLEFCACRSRRRSRPASRRRTPR